jgi:hypothetical protein
MNNQFNARRIRWGRKRSPLKDRPLRNPGQSLDEQIRDLVSDYALGPVVFAMFMVLVTALEWLRYYRSLPPKPWLYSSVAVAALGYAVWRFFRVRSEVKSRRLGRDGEKEVGQKLEELRERGYLVFHDVLGNGFNLDHVLIGPAGVFTIETKTHSKSAAGRPTVVFDGETILIDRVKPDRDPVAQAKAQAKWLGELLRESTGKCFEVRPVIVYPGWFVEHIGTKSRQMWVLNPKGLPIFLDHEPRRLSAEDVSLAKFHLDRFVRTSAQ